jgi:hypothetical protein
LVTSSFQTGLRLLPYRIFPQLLLALFTFTASLLWVIIVVPFVAIFLPPPYEVLGGIMVAVCTLIVYPLVFFIFSTLLLDVITAVFVCYVMDVDAQVVTRPEIHQVLTMVNTPQEGAQHTHSTGITHSTHTAQAGSRYTRSSSW